MQSIKSEQLKTQPLNPNPIISENFKWGVIRDYFERNGLVKHQLNSFNDFIDNGLERIINESPIQIDKYKAVFSDIFVGTPMITCMTTNKASSLYPSHARNKDLFYDATVFVNIHETWENETTHHIRVPLCKLPIMLHSSHCNLTKLSKNECIQVGECEYDHGGYFIIKGNERTLVGQLRSIYNQPLVYSMKMDSKFKMVCDIRSMSEETGHSVQVQARLGQDNRTITFVLPYVKEPILAGIVFKALGYSTEEDLRELLLGNEKNINMETFIKYIIRDSYHIVTQQDALAFIGKFPIRVMKDMNEMAYGAQVLDNELFPHMGVSATMKEKVYLLGTMVRKLIFTYIGLRSEDDRDNYINKRVDMSGVLCFELFRTLFKKFIKKIGLFIEKKKQKPDIITLISKNNDITQGIRHSFSTGNWGIPKANYMKTGVSQVIQRLSYGSFISYLRRIAIHIGKDGKNASAKIRQLHASQAFFICPVETPDGGTIGIVLNLAMSTTVSRRISTNYIKEIIQGCKFFDNPILYKSYTKIYINGCLVGVSINNEKFMEELNQYKFSGLLDKEVTFVYDDIDDEIKIFSDEGRFLRPLFNVKKMQSISDFELNYVDIEKTIKKYGSFTNSSCIEGKVVYKEINTDEMIDNLIIEYVDNSRLEMAVVAMQPDEIPKIKADYLELAPALMLGVIASTIPFPNRTQAARCIFQAGMGKQSIGVYALSHNMRSDTTVHMLHYPQKSLVTTRVADIIGFDTMMYGMNAIVAIACYGGWNVEDSIIMNKGSIDRGMFIASTYKSITIMEIKPEPHSYEAIEIPPDSVKNKRYNYSHVDDTGIVKEGVELCIDDVIVAKTLHKAGGIKEDVSYAIRKGETGVVDKVFVLVSITGFRIIKIKIRTLRIPEVGDKGAAMAAQKGTFSIIMPQEDMPFSAQTGMTPDVILNPHCISSRMTANVLVEGVLGKACLMNGRRGDATPFVQGNKDGDVEYISDELARCGFERYGNETMINGYTGETMQMKIFIGPMTYLRLKHLASDKIHSRSSGQVTSLYRQPTAGRSRDGGLRCGELEKDALIAHGSTRFLRERLYEKSDPFQISICDICGNIATSPNECKICETDQISRCDLPYASKLLLQELHAMGIKTLIKTQNSKM
jgi:DNA-directed RNA polymerase II subunit RPB2